MFQSVGAASLQSVLCEDEASVMPVRQTCPDEGVPPLVRTTEDIKLARQNTLGKLCNVEGEGRENKQIEDDYSGQEYLHFITTQPLQHCPVYCWNKTIDCEGAEVDESEDDVLILVHLVPEDCTEHNEPNNSGHVECAPGGIAPESVVNTWGHKQLVMCFIFYVEFSPQRKDAVMEAPIPARSIIKQNSCAS